MHYKGTCTACLLLVTRPERKGIHVVLSAVIVYRAVINEMLVKTNKHQYQKSCP